MSYQAIVCKIQTRPHPNADRLQLGTVLGFQVVVGLDTQDGELGVFFPTDGRLSLEMAEANDLIRRKDPVTGKPAGGMFDENRRVRSQKLRGERSDGYWTPLSSLAWTGADLGSLSEGDQFDSLNGHQICEKYYTQATLKAMKGGTQKTRKVNRYFAEHVDTKQLRYEIGQIPEDSIIYVTLKLHGTCLTSHARIRMWDGSTKKMSQVEVGDFVVGQDGGELVKSEVLDVFTTGRANNWIEIKTKRNRLSNGNSFAKLVCTDDHLIMTPSGWVEASHLKVGDRVVQARKDYALTPFQKSILLGKILGDGTLSHRDRASNIIEFRHSSNQEEYIRHTLDLLGNVAHSELRSYTSGYGSPIVAARTVFASTFVKEFGDFYVGDKKEVPAWVADKLDPIAIAFWYMDDGSLAHSEFQNDRANFATCGFSESSIDVLLVGLANNGIRGVKYCDSKGFWRIRINTIDAYKMFNLIAPYVHESLEYKLPQEMRGLGSKVDLSSNAERSWTAVDDTVISCEPANRPRTMKWDISTTTKNFVANEILVHNSHRIGHVLDETAVPLRWWEKVLRREPQVFEEYKVVNGTRRTVLSQATSRNDFYGDDGGFRLKAVEGLAENLHRGEVVYGEIVGWTESSAPIMAPHSTKDLKELKRDFGDQMIYKYGQPKGTCQFYIYRITNVNEEGVVTELSWPQVRARAHQLGYPHVPDMAGPFVFKATDEARNRLLELAEALGEGADPLDASHIREGVVVRVERPDGEVQFLKAKSFAFGVCEGYLKTKEDVVDLEEIS